MTGREARGSLMETKVAGDTSRSIVPCIPLSVVLSQKAVICSLIFGRLVPSSGFAAPIGMYPTILLPISNLLPRCKRLSLLSISLPFEPLLFFGSSSILTQLPVLLVSVRFVPVSAVLFVLVAIKQNEASSKATSQLTMKSECLMNKINSTRVST